MCPSHSTLVRQPGSHLTDFYFHLNDFVLQFFLYNSQNIQTNTYSLNLDIPIIWNNNLVLMQEQWLLDQSIPIWGHRSLNYQFTDLWMCSTWVAYPPSCPKELLGVSNCNSLYICPDWEVIFKLFEEYYPS